MLARPRHFNAFIWPNGYHESAWRVDDDVNGVVGLPYYAEIARIAERGLMDSIFLADNIAIPEYRVTHLPQTQFDPVVALSVLAGITGRIGLIATGSTTYSKPWDLARRFATLDHLSGGRAGWNIVTTSTPLVPRTSARAVTRNTPTGTHGLMSSWTSYGEFGTAGKLNKIDRISSL
jgi:N-acetyl-S-(2-succino)cysteine monooxygenase